MQQEADLRAPDPLAMDLRPGLCRASVQASMPFAEDLGRARANTALWPGLGGLRPPRDCLFNPPARNFGKSPVT